MIQSVHRAALILNELGSARPRLGVTELAERLGLAKATVYGLVRALELEGLVERDAETGKYRLGPALLQLGNAFLDNHEIRARSLLWAESLATRTGEAVRVGVPNGANVLIVHHVFRPDNSVQILEVGAAIPWHASALGKAIVANREAQERRTYLDRPLSALTGRTITDPVELGRSLERIAREGFAVDDEEGIIGEAEVAAAVFDHRGVAVGAIGVAGGVERVLPDGRPSTPLVAAVREAARGLSRDLGAGNSRRRAAHAR